MVVVYIFFNHGIPKTENAKRIFQIFVHTNISFWRLIAFLQVKLHKHYNDLIKVSYCQVFTKEKEDIYINIYIYIFHGCDECICPSVKYSQERQYIICSTSRNGNNVLYICPNEKQTHIYSNWFYTKKVYYNSAICLQRQKIHCWVKLSPPLHIIKRP